MIENPTNPPAIDVDHEDYADICSFCAEIRAERDNNLLGELMPDCDPVDFRLHQTENFVVVPGVGAFCDGYIIVTPKEHLLSFGHLASDLDAELTDLFSRLRTYLQFHYERPVLAFEHGAESFRNRGGSCTDHAHIHMFPAEPTLDLVGALTPDFEPRQVASFLPALREQVVYRRQPYLWVETVRGVYWLCDAPKTLSQFIRRVIVRDLGRPDQWDWAVFPGVPHLREIMQRFHDHPFK